MKRETGYYWVKRSNCWTVGYFDGCLSWLLFEHGSKLMHDDDFELICENRIKEPFLVKIDKAQTKRNKLVK